MAKPGKEKGFILITILILMLLVAVTAMSLNFKSGLQVEMAVNQSADAQTYFGQLAAIEQSLWKLTGDPSWRVSAGEDYAYQGRTYNRKVFSHDAVTYPALTSYKDAVIISIRAPNASRPVNTSFRYNIDTVAGTGLSSPQGMATYYDTAKKKLFLYIADSGNHCIKKLDTSTNVIDLVAGTLGLPSPRGVAPYYDAVQKNLFLYIADSENHRIWKLDTVTNAIATIAGTGVATEPAVSPVDNILAVNTTLNSPADIAVDALGNVYIADTGNDRIRKVTVATGVITTIAGGFIGTGETNPDPTKMQLVSPSGVFVDTAGNIYIADTGKHKIRMISATTGAIRLVAGTGTDNFSGDGGAATAAQLNSPQRISVDGVGNIYIADTKNHRLRLVNIHDSTISTMAGTGTGGYDGDLQPAVQAQLNFPGGVALGLQKAGGRIFISDTGNNRVRVLFLKTVKQVY